MNERNASGIDYDRRAAGYAAHRAVNPAVIQALIDSGLFGPETRVLDVGCGTGNYAAALTSATHCRMSGIDPSAEMLKRARQAAPWDTLVQGSAELLPFAGGAFDLVMSTDVIHHIGDRDDYFAEAARVLREGGRIVSTRMLRDGGRIITVTDSHDDIRRRQPLSSFFPETVEVELQRYPPLPLLLEEMARAGFTAVETVEVTHPYELTDLQPYRGRAFSSLSLIDEDAFQRGIARLEAALEQGPISCLSRYTLIWGTLPPA